MYSRIYNAVESCTTTDESSTGKPDTVTQSQSDSLILVPPKTDPVASANYQLTCSRDKVVENLKRLKVNQA